MKQKDIEALRTEVYEFPPAFRGGLIEAPLNEGEIKGRGHSPPLFAGASLKQSQGSHQSTSSI